MDGVDSYTDIGLVKRVCKKKLTFTPRRMMTDKVKEKVHILFYKSETPKSTFITLESFS